MTVCIIHSYFFASILFKITFVVNNLDPTTPIQFGIQFVDNGRPPIELLYSGNHYDVIIQTGSSEEEVPAASLPSPAEPVRTQTR